MRSFTWYSCDLYELGSQVLYLASLHIRYFRHGYLPFTHHDITKSFRGIALVVLLTRKIPFAVPLSVPRLVFHAVSPLQSPHLHLLIQGVSHQRIPHCHNRGQGKLLDEIQCGARYHNQHRVLIMRFVNILSFVRPAIVAMKEFIGLRYLRLVLVHN